MPSKALSLSTQSRSSAERVLKRRAACEECRTKKLKCSGGQPSCERCVRESIRCCYSIQKQMGRPQKRKDDHSARPSEQPRDDDHASMTPHEQTAADLMDADVLVPYASNHLETSRLIDQSAGSNVPIESSLPGLNPDTSANSPPLLQLPPELQRDIPRDILSPSLFDSSLAHNTFGLDCKFATGLLPCACLSSMYLGLNNLQQMTEPYQFPTCLAPLREAMRTTSSVLQCSECPRQFITGIQNTQMMGTLLVSIAERFGKALDAITSEAVRADMLGETKQFRLVDLNTENGHLHAGGLGCAAAFSIDLSPQEWRGMAKKVVRTEVYGPHAGAGLMSADAPNNSSFIHDASRHDPHASRVLSHPEHASCSYLMGLIQQMLTRQKRWHADVPPNDFPLDGQGNLVGRMRSSEGDHLCMKMPAFAAQLADSFDWS